MATDRTQRVTGSAGFQPACLPKKWKIPLGNPRMHPDNRKMAVRKFSLPPDNWKMAVRTADFLR